MGNCSVQGIPQKGRLNPGNSRTDGFSLVELMTALVILSLIMLLILGITQQTGNAWRSSRSKIETFQTARAAFQQIVGLLGQATLNIYYDYFDASGKTPLDTGFSGPDHFGRQSDLHFVSGKSLAAGQVTHAVFFQTPAGYTDDPAFEGLDTLLNACGFYVEYSNDRSRPAFLDTIPDFPENKSRYRLMELFQPSQELSVFTSRTGNAWFTGPLAANPPPVSQLSPNIVAFVILPKRSEADATAGGAGPAPLAPQYEYDSRQSGKSGAQLPTENQLPPLVEVVLVAIDEASAERLGNSDLGVSSLFADAANLETDLKTLEKNLAKEHLTYRIFRATVALKNSKWTS